jgi:hypothetical protein
LEVVLLDRDAFFGEFTRSLSAPPPLGELGVSWDDLVAEKRDTEDLIRAALAKCWRKHDDFEVGWDSNYAMTMCGGVYSARILCKDYLEVLHGVLRSARHYPRWAYSTSVELDTAVNGMKDCDFVLQGERVTVENWGLGEFNFVEHFSRSSG